MGRGMGERPGGTADDPSHDVAERPSRSRGGRRVPVRVGHRADLGHQTAMDVVEPATDGVGRPLAIDGYGVGVHP